MKEFDFVFNEDFKEDSVREFIISPLLKELGFMNRDSKNPKPLELALSLKITAPTILGSNEKITFTRFPDYVLYVDSRPHCVLDAKAPNIAINAQSKAERQAFYYAINPELKVPFYALCNGKSLTLFETNGQNLLKEFSCEEVFVNNFGNENFVLLKQYLTTPIESLKQTLAQDSKTPKKPDEWYLSRELPKAIANPKKQAKARYFGCTAYFTRQSWDIVTQNIKNFTDRGDVVLDSFGGSGVTAIEAMMQGRIGIHTDLNPLSIFMAKALSVQVDLSALYDLSEEILKEFENLKPKNDKEARQILKGAKYYPNALDSEFGEIATQKQQDSTLWIPQDEVLPKGSDVDCVLGIFSNTQLAELALLRKLIFKHTTPSGSKENRIRKRNLRYSLMLGFYNTLSICNLTFHETPRGGGVSGIYAYYRYRIAPNPAKHQITNTFRRKIKLVIRGKKELESAPSDLFYQSYFYPLKGVIKDFSGSLIAQRENLENTDSILNKTNGEKIFQADATDLKEIESLSVDFIYTDPPYGAKIPYLDLSTMWNVWLDLPVDASLKEKECIEKGSLEKSKYEYYDLMKKSLKEMYRVLKWNRWLAFVFQHQDPKLWQIIIDSAENIGFEYAGSVIQDNGQESFKRVQNPSFVLSGQIIIYFKKVDNAKVRAKIEVGMDIMEKMFKDIEAIIVENNGVNLSIMWRELMKKAIDGNYTDKIAQKFETFIPAINERFECDKNGKYHLRENASFSNYEIPLEKRAEYLIRAILGRAKEQNKGVKFNEIVLKVIPLSSNGVQANNKLIREILSEIATTDRDTGEWKLKDKIGTQGSLFND